MHAMQSNYIDLWTRISAFVWNSSNINVVR